jgi:hypothetical protein
LSSASATKKEKFDNIDASKVIVILAVWVCLANADASGKILGPESGRMINSLINLKMEQCIFV